MKKIMTVVLAFAFLASAAFAYTDGDARRDIYEKASLQASVKFIVTMWMPNSRYESRWEKQGSAPIYNGESQIDMDLEPGPGLYGGYAEWLDKYGMALFRTQRAVLSTFRSNFVNLKDFPVQLVESRYVRFDLKVDGITPNDPVWLNGEQAYYSDGYWRAWINQPWNVDKLDIVWGGHGHWVQEVDPSFDFGQILSFDESAMDPSVQWVVKMAGLSYSAGDGPVYDTIKYVGYEYDSIRACYVFVFKMTYEELEALAFFSYFDEYYGMMIEYGNHDPEVHGNKYTLRVPLKDFGVGNNTSIRFVFKDPADGCIKQTPELQYNWWDYPIDNTSSGGVGGSSGGK